MASDLDPPLRGEPILDEFGNFNIRYAEFFSKAANSANESADAIEIINDRLDAIELRLDLLEARVTYLEGLTIVTAVNVTIDNSVTGNQVIICTDTLTVTMAAIPLDKDVVEVKSTNGNVIIDGNGNNIDGDSTVTIRRNYTGLSMEYSTTADAWFIL